MGEGNADGVSDVRGEEEPEEEHGVRGDDGVAYGDVGGGGESGEDGGVTSCVGIPCRVDQ